MATTSETAVVLNAQNSVQILSQYIELAQSKGAYLLNEAELLKRATDVLVNNVEDNEVNPTVAKQLLVQGIHKGQRHGAYTLNDAAILSKVVQFVASTPDTQVPSTPAPSPRPQSHVQSSGDDDDLSELAQPIPLKPKEI
jgi:hypothetical protein